MHKNYVYGNKPLVNIRNNKQGFPASIGRIGRSNWPNLNASKSIRRVPPPANLPSLKSQREPAVLRETQVAKSVPPTKWRMKESTSTSIETDSSKRSPWNFSVSEDGVGSPTIADFPKLKSTGKSSNLENRSTISSTTENLSLWRDESTVRCTVDRSLPVKPLGKPSASVNPCPRSPYIESKPMGSYDNWSNAPTTIDYSEKIVFSDGEDEQILERSESTDDVTDEISSTQSIGGGNRPFVSTEYNTSNTRVDWFSSENPSESNKSAVKKLSPELSTVEKPPVFDEEEMWNQRLSDNIMKESIERAKQKLAEERELARKQKRLVENKENYVEESSLEFITDRGIGNDNVKNVERIDYFEDPLIENGIPQLHLHDKNESPHFEGEQRPLSQQSDAPASNAGNEDMLKNFREIPPSGELNMTTVQTTLEHGMHLENNIDNSADAVVNVLVNEGMRASLNESFNPAKQQALMQSTLPCSSSSPCGYYNSVSQQNEPYIMATANKQTFSEFPQAQRLLKGNILHNVNNNSGPVFNSTAFPHAKPYCGQMPEPYQSQPLAHNVPMPFSSKNCKMRPLDVDNGIKINAEPYGNIDRIRAQYPRKNDNIYCQLNQQVYLNPLPHHFPESVGTAYQNYDMPPNYSNQCYVKDPSRFSHMNFFDLHSSNAPDEYAIDSRRVNQYSRSAYPTPYFQGNMNCVSERYGSPASRPCPAADNTKYLNNAQFAASTWNMASRRSLTNFTPQPHSFIFGDTRDAGNAPRNNESLMNSGGVHVMHPYPNINRPLDACNSYSFPSSNNNNKTVHFTNKPLSNFEEERSFPSNEAKQEKMNMCKYVMFRDSSQSLHQPSTFVDKCTKSESVESLLDDSSQSSLDFCNDDMTDKEIKTVVFEPSGRNFKSRGMHSRCRTNKGDFALAPGGHSHQMSKTAHKHRDNVKRPSEKKLSKRAETKAHPRKEANTPSDFLNSAHSVYSEESVDAEEEKKNVSSRQSGNAHRIQGKNRHSMRGKDRYGNVDSNNKKKSREVNAKRDQEWYEADRHYYLQDRMDQWGNAYEDQGRSRGNWQSNVKNYRRQRENKSGGTYWNSGRYTSQKNSSFKMANTAKTNERSNIRRQTNRSRRCGKDWESESEFSHISGQHESVVNDTVDYRSRSDFDKKQIRKRNNQAEQSKSSCNFWTNKEKDDQEPNQKTSSSCLPPRFARKKNTDKRQDERKETENEEAGALVHIDKWENCMADGYQQENIKSEKKTDNYLSGKGYNEGIMRNETLQGHGEDKGKNVCSDYKFDGSMCESNRPTSMDAKLDSVKVLWGSEESKSQTSSAQSRVPTTFESTSANKTDQKNICTVKPTQPVYPLISETNSRQDLSTSYAPSNTWDSSANNRFQYNHTNGIPATAPQSSFFAFPNNNTYQPTSVGAAGYGYFQQPSHMINTGTSSMPAGFQSNPILTATPLQHFFHVDNNMITHRSAPADQYYSHSQNMNAIQLNTEPIYQANYSHPHHANPTAQREIVSGHEYPFGPACMDDLYAQNLNVRHPLAPQKLLVFPGVVHGNAQQKPFKTTSSFNARFPASRQRQSIPTKVDFHEQNSGEASVKE